MSSEILNPPLCCADPCCESETVNIPGVPGSDGAAGAAGSDGVSAFTETTASFIMPAEGATVQIDVLDTSWMVPDEAAVLGHILVIQFAGSLAVVSIDSATEVTVRNIADVAAGEYPTNAPPTTNIPSGSVVAPGGQQGPIGPTEAGAFLIVNNLSEGVAATMRSNLGLGTLATLSSINNANWSGTDLSVANGGTGASSAAAARTSLGAAASGLATASGLTVSTGERILGKASGAPAGAVEEIVCTSFAQTLLDDSTAAAARATLGIATASGGYAFSAIQTAPQGFANITLTQVEFGATEYDDDGVWDTATFEYEAQADGLYAFKVQVFWPAMPAGVVPFHIEYQVNGTKVSENNLSQEATLAGITHFDVLSLSLGDIVTVWASQTSGGGESTDDTASITFLRGWAISTT